MKNVVWTGSSSGLEGEFQSGSEVDFYIDGVSHLEQVLVCLSILCISLYIKEGYQTIYYNY